MNDFQRRLGFTTTFLFTLCAGYGQIHAKAASQPDALDLTAAPAKIFSTNRPSQAVTNVSIARAALLATAKLPTPVPLPVPGTAIALPDEPNRDAAPVSLRFSQGQPDDLAVRRVAGPEGLLFLEVYSPHGPIPGEVEVTKAGQTLGRAQGSVWLSAKPRIGRISIQVFSPNAKEPLSLTAPTALVEVRGRKIFLNGEPFLLKGATGRGLTTEDAAYVHSLGLNTLRGLGALPDAERYGFMNISSLNFGALAPTTVMRAPDEEFEQSLEKSLEWLKENSAAPIASPYTLILQLGNERTGAGNLPPGAEPLTLARRRVSQLLSAARDLVKPLAPMLPVGYANQDLGFLAPDCMDVYMHNSYLDKDRYDYPWEEFMKWQGCLPPDGKTGEGRPFVNSEFGANRYLCQSYHAGPNNPFLERIHAWNFPCRWSEFMQHGAVGGAIYCLYDLETPRDQGCSRFGILTTDGKPKLACWEVGHLWRDFEVEPRGKSVVVSFKRDYWARDCRLTLAPVGGRTITRSLEDFPPRSSRKLTFAVPSNGFRWTLDFTTHSGLTNKAAGAWPQQLEERDFLDRLKARDTFPFLRELFDTQVLTATGKPAPLTLAEMTNEQGLIPVALRKRNGVTYLLLIARESPKDGALREGVTIDVLFPGKVVKVDDMTGEPLPDLVDASPFPGGLRLKNIKAARIPGPIGQRSEKPFALPLYRISP